MGPLKLSSGETTDNPGKMAEAFSGAYASAPLPNPEPHQICNSSMPNILITHIQVQEVLQELDVNSSGGSDGVHPRFLKELAAEYERLQGEVKSLRDRLEEEEFARKRLEERLVGMSEREEADNLKVELEKAPNIF